MGSVSGAARNLAESVASRPAGGPPPGENLRVDGENKLAERDLRMVPCATIGLMLLPEQGFRVTPLAAFEGSCPRCANEARLCCRLCKPLCVVIPSFLHSSAPGQLPFCNNMSPIPQKALPLSL